MDCSRGGADHPCRTVPGARELVVRIMPVPEREAIRSRERLVDTRASRVPLISSWDSPRWASRRGAGILATVYYESVLAVARNSGVATSKLLGRAIAHEVGHLLLPGGGHSPSGLMRAPWAYEELTENRREDWLFSPQDRRELRAARRPLAKHELQAEVAVVAALAIGAVAVLAQRVQRRGRCLRGLPITSTAGAVDRRHMPARLARPILGR